MMKGKATICSVAVCAAVVGAQAGCLVAVAGGAGAEAGYVSAQDDRSAGETMGDQWITTKVKSQLLVTKGVNSLHITITVDKGVVTLYGYVATAEMERRAVEAVQGIKGVQSVSSRLTVTVDPAAAHQ
jgi:hyperosmotically inducible periplasmic protein